VSGQGVVDELGLGAIHTGYADHFFPGTSVLHTRARYAFFVPWTFLHLARRKVAREAVAKRKREIETCITKRLIDHVGATGDRVGAGIIGVRIHPKPPAQPPDFAYWTAMRTWGLLECRARTSLLGRWSPKEVVRATDLRAGGEEDLATEPLAVFNVPPMPEDWPEGFAGGFDLTAVEAEWLRLRWSRMTGPSLLRSLATLLPDASIARNAALWDHPLVREAAAHADREDTRGPRTLSSFTAAVAQARLASAAAEIVRATYGAYVEAEWLRDRRAATGSEVQALGYRETLGSYFDKNAVKRELLLTLDLAALKRDLPGIERNTRHLGDLLGEFQRAWRAAKRVEDVLADVPLRTLCGRVERDRKGRRARLHPVTGRENRADFADSTVRAAGIDYRWTTTLRLLRDVSEGLNRG
jgi:hypothetical protein